jgi:putative ABC transport system permease protein
MSAVRLRFGAELRRQWRAWLVLAALAGLAGGIVVALSAGARRTASALDRYTVAVHYADAYVVKGFAFGGDSLDLDLIARAPQVVESQQSAELAVVSRSRTGHAIYPAGPDSVLYRVPTDGRHANAIDRPQVIDGRLPDPARADEALADVNARDSLASTVGDTVGLRLISQHTLVTRPDIHLTVDPRTARYGPFARVRIVGVAATSQPTGGQGAVLLTPAFYRHYGRGALGAFTHLIALRLRHGQADLPAFRLAVGRVAGRKPYALFEPTDALPRVQRSIDVQAAALRLLAACAAAAALLVVAQAQWRQAALAAGDQAIMRALGMTRGQLVALGGARALAVAIPAAATTAGVAIALSPLLPIGRARDLEPDPGFAIDPGVVAAGAAAVLVAVLGAGVLASWRLARPGTRARAAASAPGALWRAVARWPPPIAGGVRMALVRREGAVAVPVRGTIAAAILAVGVAAVAATFAASLDHLLSTPRLYGQTWDFESGAGPEAPAALVRRIVRDPDFAAVAVGNDSSVEIGGHEVAVRAMENVKDAIATPIVAGRAPRGPGEMAMAPKTLEALRSHVGAVVRVRSGTRVVALRVVGRAILPPSGNRDKLGEGATLSFAALRRLQPQVPRTLFEVRIAERADRAAALARLANIFDPSAAVRPSEVGDYGGVNATPVIIAALFAAIALAALAHSLVTSIRRRRRDLAVYKTLGFTRRQVLATVVSQATTVAALGLLFGLPLGVASGRFAWNLFADWLGVVPEPVSPLAALALLVPATILVAALVAALPGHMAARLRPALVLRAE